MKRSRSVDEDEDGTTKSSNTNFKKKRSNSIDEEEKEENESLLNGMEALYYPQDFTTRKVSTEEVSTDTIVYDVFTKEQQKDMEKDDRGTAPLVLCLFGTNTIMKEFKKNVWKQRALVTRGTCTI